MDQLSSNVAKALSELIDGSQQTLVSRLEERIDILETNSRELAKDNISLKTSSQETVTRINELAQENATLKESLHQVTEAKDALAREQAEWMKLGTTLATSVRDLQTFTSELESRLRIVQKQVIASAASPHPDPYRHHPQHPNEVILELSRQAGKLKGEIDILNNLQRSFEHSSSSRNQSFTTTTM